MKDYTPVEDHETPYDKAKKEFGDHIGIAKQQAYHYRLFLLLTLLLLALSCIGNIYLSNKSSIIPYVIEVDKQTGAVLSANKVFRASFKIKDSSIKHKINRFIKNIRSISTDPIVVRGNYKSAYQMLTRRGIDFFKVYRDQYQPKQKIGKKAISVSNMAITKITDKSFQVEWLETEFDIAETNAKAGSHKYTGTVTVKIAQVNNLEDLTENPLGIYIDEFHITKKY